MITLPPALARFPFPFRTDTYRYSANVEPAGKVIRTGSGKDDLAWGENILEVDAGYAEELAARAEILDRDPTRAATSPYMAPAEWDALIFCLTELAATYPVDFEFTRDGDAAHWRNRLQGRELTFTVGDAATVLGGPLRFLATQIQEDVALLDQREGALWLDAGVVTFAADWSMGFDTGMRFREIHGPVPRVHEEGIIARAEEFLMRLQPGDAYRRTNWTLTIDGRLDTATETYPEWGPDRVDVVDDPHLLDRVYLRVEVQHLIRLPHSGAIAFLIHSYLQPLSALAQHPDWRRTMASVFAELPADMAAYKGIDRYAHQAARLLQT